MPYETLILLFVSAPAVTARMRHALFYSGQCWCDNGTADYEQNGPAVCDFECAGSTDGELCGGYDAMSIRQHDVSVIPYYLGCFSNMPSNGIFLLVDSSDDMTAEVSGQRASRFRCSFWGRGLSC